MSGDWRRAALVPRGSVACALTDAVQALHYGNFKDSVSEDDRHQAYAVVWNEMLRLQARVNVAPAGSAPRGHDRL
jgi:hypothetical protein